MATNFRFIVGDKVKFTLTPIATMKKGNHFVGFVVAIKPKIYSLVIKPSIYSSSRLSSMLNPDGLITVQFRCCKLYSQVLATQLRIEMLKKQLSTENNIKPQLRKSKPKKGWQYAGGKL